MVPVPALFRNGPRFEAFLFQVKGDLRLLFDLLLIVRSPHYASALSDEALDSYKRSFRHRAVKDAWLRQVHARDLDDALPCGFLAGAMVEVWVALRLNWA